MKHTPSVLFVSRKWPPAVGGMETYSVEYTKALRRHARVDTLVLPGRQDGRSPSTTKMAAFFLRSVAWLTVYGRRYDVIHFGDFVLFPLLLWTRIVAPRAHRCLTVHGLDLLYGRKVGWTPRLYRFYMKLALSLQTTCHAFIANSTATAQRAGQLGLRNVTAVPLGVSREELCHAVLNNPAPMQNPGPRRHVLFVGRIVKRKGPAWFAVNVLPGLPDDVEFLVAGQTVDSEESKRLTGLPRVRLLGPLPKKDIIAYQTSGAITVVPNLRSTDDDFEGFGLVALEAVAHGSVVVASAVDGLTDAIRHLETGFLVTPESSEDWRETISMILSWDLEKRRLFLLHARNTVATQQTWDRVARETLNALQTENRVYLS